MRSNLRSAPLLVCLILLLVGGCSTSGWKTPELPRIPNRTFDVKDFGVKADGVTKDSQAINRALETAEKAGGGTVRFGPGTYFTGMLQLRSRVGIHLDKGATILFSTDPADYPVVLTRWEGTECMNYSGLIYGRDLEDIAITGEGTFDGQGAAWWPWSKRSGPTLTRLRELGETTDDPTQRVFGTVEAALRPCLFEPINCKRILLQGVTFTNSPFWTLHPLYSSDITARSITVLGDGPNTDGFDPDSCKDMLVERCTFDTGDDCVTLKSGRDRDGRRVGKPLENIVVRECFFKRGHGTVVIGSEMSGGVRNVLAENFTADGNDAGVRIKSRRGRGGVVENITYRNIRIKNIQRQAITIDMFYDVGNNPGVKQTDPAGVPVYRNITIENLHCESAVTAIVLRGLPDSPITGLKLKNVSITADLPGVISGADLTDFQNVKVRPTIMSDPTTQRAPQPATMPK